jgi:hypothetical protein
MGADVLILVAPKSLDSRLRGSDASFSTPC